MPSSQVAVEFSETETILSDDKHIEPYNETSPCKKSFNQKKLNDLVRDLNLSKDAAEILASRLHDKALLDIETCVTFYRTREHELLRFFCNENGFLFCNDITRLMLKMGLTKYIPDKWRLFIDSCKRSLKCMLLHNGNKYASIPIAHSTKLKEEYETIRLFWKKLIIKNINGY